MNGQIEDRQGNKLPAIPAQTSTVEALRKLFGEQKSMW